MVTAYKIIIDNQIFYYYYYFKFFLLIFKSKFIIYYLKIIKPGQPMNQPVLARVVGLEGGTG